MFIFHFAKILVICWLGEKSDDLFRKNSNIKGRGGRKGVKEEIFTVLEGKNNILEKGGGANISISWTMYTPVS